MIAINERFKVNGLVCYLDARKQTPPYPCGQFGRVFVHMQMSSQWTITTLNLPSWKMPPPHLQYQRQRGWGETSASAADWLTLVPSHSAAAFKYGVERRGVGMYSV
jgi:hypothetical protein